MCITVKEASGIIKVIFPELLLQFHQKEILWCDYGFGLSCD